MSNSADSFQWAIDNVYIGSGCSLECVQHGNCVDGTCRYVPNSTFKIQSHFVVFCRCDDGFFGDQCQPIESVPSFREEFDATLQSNRWPVVLGGSILQAGVASGNTLVFFRVNFYLFMLVCWCLHMYVQF